MDFRHSDRSQALQAQVQQFLDEHVYPAEHEFEQQASGESRGGRIRSARRTCSPG